MIEKFASLYGAPVSEFLDLNHTSKIMILVSLLIPKFALRPPPRVPANFGIGTLGRAKGCGWRIPSASRNQVRQDGHGIELEFVKRAK